MDEFHTVLGGVVPVFIIIGAGLLMRRLNWLTEEADQSLLRISINLLVPCLIIDSVMGNEALRRAENIVVPPLLGFGMAALGIWVARVFAGWCKLPSDEERRAFALTAGLQNYVYFPLPLSLLLFSPGTTGVLLVHNVGVETALWTVGVAVLSGKGLDGGWRKIINAPLIALVVAVIANLSSARVSWPPFAAVSGHMLLTAAHMLGQCAIPVALLLTGATIADHLASAHGGSTARVVTLALLVRLGLLPIPFMLLAKYFPCSLELKRVLVLQGAMSSAVFPIVMTRHYGGDTRTALQVVLGTTLGGLVTIPLWIRFGGHIAGLW